jgi:hypothetical protein
MNKPIHGMKAIRLENVEFDILGNITRRDHAVDLESAGA